MTRSKSPWSSFRFKKNKKIDLERIKFLDGLNWEEYINHCGEVSVLLDPIYYGMSHRDLTILRQNLKNAL
mgnify:CR=1 FL=1